jgi:ankyrin repeat protein/thiol-disulfide isomerase/thioredoxin
MRNDCKLVRLAACLVLAAVSPLSADESDDTLRHWLAKSEVVVAGTIASEPIGIVTEAGVVNYSFEFRVSETLCGTWKGEPTLRAGVVRFENDPRDRLPYLKQDSWCILFLKSAGERTIPAWTTADFWFGVQPYSAPLARAIKRLAESPPGSEPAAGVTAPREPPAASSAAGGAAKAIDKLNDHGFSQLHIAAMGGNAPAAATLLKQGADVNVRQGTYEGTPLQYAAAAGHLAVIKVLIENDAAVDARDTQGRTPLMWAASKGQVEAVKALLDAGAEIAAATLSGWTPLHYASSESQPAAVKLLIERGAPTDARNSAGNTPAQVAPVVAPGPAESSTAPAGAAKPIDALNERGFSKLHMAAMGGAAQAAATLLKQGADVNVRQGTYQGTPLQYAAAAGHLAVVKTLIDNDAAVDARDTHGRTPLMWSAWKGQVEAVKALLDAGANIAGTSNVGWTPLHFASSESQTATVKLLIERGAPADARDSAGKTPAEVGPGAAGLPVHPPEETRAPPGGQERFLGPRVNGTVRANPAAGQDPNLVRVAGKIVSSEYATLGGGVDRSIIYVYTQPAEQRIQDKLFPTSAFELQLQPGTYRLFCSALGTRGATFEPLYKEITVRAGQGELDLGAVDLPISRTTKLYFQPAPELRGVAGWKHTSPLSLEKLRGQVVVLDFFTFYCSICHEHKPDLARLYEKYRKQGLAVLAIHNNELKSMEELAEKMDPILGRVFRGQVPEIPMALDGPGADNVFHSYGISGVPAVILIDPQGRVVRRFHHAGLPELEQEIRRLLQSPEL